MHPETPSARTTPETPSALRNEPFTQPTLLPVCCLCGLIRDNRGSSPDPERWLTPRTYQQTHGVHPDDCSFTPTYCPACLTKVRETTAQYFRQIDGSREAPDRASDQRSKASAPPGVSCLRCGGLLIPDYTASLERRDTGTPVTLRRCVNCGNCMDLDILANRGKRPQPARPRTRPPTGPPRTGQPR